MKHPLNLQSVVEAGQPLIYVPKVKNTDASKDKRKIQRGGVQRGRKRSAM